MPGRRPLIQDMAAENSSQVPSPRWPLGKVRAYQL